MSELLSETLTVKGKTGDGYTFRIPSIYDDLKIASRAKDIRKEVDPTWNGIELGLGWEADFQLRACATFDTQLVKTSATWVHTKDEKTGMPVVNSSKFPPQQAHEVVYVYDQYLSAVARFRQTGSVDEVAAGEKAVASEPDSGGPQPV